MKASDYIIKFLKDKGIEIVFGYSGGAITHLLDSVNKLPGIRFIQTYHEQTASIAAEGYSWASGFFGVAIATSGPGATNMITGIADAFFDSIPVLFITGQVNTFEYKSEKPIRQQGFQETDIVSIVKPITKYAKMIVDPNELRYELEKAFSIASAGRQGPVLLDIPMDVQRSDLDPTALKGFKLKSINERESLRYLGGFSRDALNSLIKKSMRPMLLLGSGVKIDRAIAEVRALVRDFQIPVVTSLLGKGAFPEDESMSMGMIGSYGNRCANIALANADLLIAIGTRLDTRQTGTNLSSFLRGGKIVRVDIDEDELGNHRLKDVAAVHGSAKSFIAELSMASWGDSREQWIEYLKSLKAEYNQDKEVLRNVENRRPYRVMDILNQYASEDQIFTVDIGQNQMFAAQKICIRERQTWKTSGGLAPMGFAVPAAIGAFFATHGARPIFAIVGDGGLQISSQALLTVAQYNAPIKIILINNKTLGMITQFQDLYFDRRKEGTTKDSGYLVPDFNLLAKSYGLSFFKIGQTDFANEEIIDKAFRSNGPSVIEFDVGEDTVVYPKLEVNMPIEDISPRLERDEFQRVMIIDNVEDISKTVYG